MKLSDIAKGLKYEVLQGSDNLEIEKIEYDSRKVGKGSLFVCIEGLKADGHKFAAAACSGGASAIVCRYMPEGLPAGVTVLKFDDTREALAELGAAFYGFPSKDMNVIGVTGTNGKTTTTYLIKSVLDKLGRKTGLIGTIENKIGTQAIHAERTTPESLELQELFGRMRDEGCTDAVMEVSSHALDLKRVFGVEFNIGIFTNLTQDHLDYHKTMESYRDAKALLFKSCKAAVINMDDAAGEHMKSVSCGKTVTFAIERPADLRAENIMITADGVYFTLDYAGTRHEVSLHTPGKFSIYNALGALGACVLMGIDLKTAISAIGENMGVHGRFQTIKSKRGVNAIVDYAHTPDGLENILKTAREFVQGRIITVFGCGGDRDRTKRPIMGEIAGRLSDFCVITSDNPRTEQPERILEDIEPGTRAAGCEYTMITDRREAIHYAVGMAVSGDVVVIAGKGHEDYQIFADKTIHFDDVEEVRDAFGEDLK